MRNLKFEDFSGHVGQDYEVPVQGGSLKLNLEAAQAIPGSIREGGGFRLVFRGPLQPQLIQATYIFRRGGYDDQIFVVPVAADERGIQYEAIFY